VTPRGPDVTGDPCFPEVPEGEAQGVVADIYADIRNVLGLPVVNLVYRCLAVEPTHLASIWRTLRPNLTSRRADEEAPPGRNGGGARSGADRDECAHVSRRRT
jgi:hypothetical protein